MAEVRMIPNVRKVSMSPWVNEERGAAEIGRDFVYSRKPSPALLATDHFNPEKVRADLAGDAGGLREIRLPAGVHPEGHQHRAL